jgi:hypothetical protein
MERDKIHKRMIDRVDDLICLMPECIDVFNKAKLFTGPSLYFHFKTLEILRSHASAHETLHDEMFFDRLYATLTAWGMHRMGKTFTKLRDVEEIENSFREQESHIREIEKFKIDELSIDDVGPISRKIWSIVDELKVGVGRTKLIANTKALHHLLPDLVPPIDRQYTLQFFYNNTNINRNEWEMFIEMYSMFHKISLTRKHDIHRWVSERIGMNTSPTKVIDNAIVGFVIKNLKQPENKLFDGQVFEHFVDRPKEVIHLNTPVKKKLTHPEEIMCAVAKIVLKQGRDTFSRVDIRRVTGVDKDAWDASFSPEFQGMRVDHPGGAPKVNKKFQGVFYRVQHGIYTLTDYGRSLLKDFEDC